MNTHETKKFIRDLIIDDLQQVDCKLNDVNAKDVAPTSFREAMGKPDLINFYEKEQQRLEQALDWINDQIDHIHPINSN